MHDYNGKKLWKRLFAGTLPANKKLFAGTPSALYLLFSFIPTTRILAFLLYESNETLDLESTVLNNILVANS